MAAPTSSLKGETISDVLDSVPASFHVVRHIQPRFTCKGCDTKASDEAGALGAEGQVEIGKERGPSGVDQVILENVMECGMDGKFPEDKTTSICGRVEIHGAPSGRH